MELTKESAGQAVAGEILTSRRLLKRYQDDPDKVMGESLDRLGVKDAAVIAGAKKEARDRILETKEVFPGLTREEAYDLLLGSLGIPRASFTIFTALNVVLFMVGIGLLISAAVIGFVNQKEQFTVIFGAGGFGIIIYMFISNPLKRIANAASDQSQIRTVVFGFWVQLANWRTDFLEPANDVQYDTLRGVNTEVQKAMEHAVKTLQVYAESKEFTLPRPAPARP